MVRDCSYNKSGSFKILKITHTYSIQKICISFIRIKFINKRDKLRERLTDRRKKKKQGKRGREKKDTIFN